MSKFEEDVTQAFLIIRELRIRSISQGIDPRATRVALKYALLVDTYLCKQQGLTAEEDQQIDDMALDLFNKTPQIREEEYQQWAKMKKIR